ncbi:MAG: M23 family metallopeptidase [Candidatus Dojkabacteria bacterium]
MENSNFSFTKNSFFINSYTKEKPQNTNLLLNIYLSFKSKEWIDLKYLLKQKVELKRATAIQKPFSFPLDRLIGVTQWYGCTQYQCPHKGIDFGARLNKVISVGDGIVVKNGYDRYGGECNQGGNYIIVKHTNNMYSTYFHLNSYNKSVGDSVKRGEVLGISGNSGKWNCQKLGYHLHFEIRKQLSSSTHTNPTQYIDIDWNLIPTLGKEKYPARLSGENPHPNF